MCYSCVTIVTTTERLDHRQVNSYETMLELFDQVALEAILVYYPMYRRIHSEVHVRVADLPLSSTLRDLRRAT